MAAARAVARAGGRETAEVMMALAVERLAVKGLRVLEEEAQGSASVLSPTSLPCANLDRVAMARVVGREARATSAPESERETTQKEETLRPRHLRRGGRGIRRCPFGGRTTFSRSYLGVEKKRREHSLL